MATRLPNVRHVALCLVLIFSVTYIYNYLLNRPVKQDRIRENVLITNRSTVYTLIHGPDHNNNSLVTENRMETGLVANRKENQPKCELGYQCKELTNISRALLAEPMTLDSIIAENPDVEMGGTWRPQDCQSKWKIALIIPIRNREEHLKTFTRNIIPFLKSQKAEFTIFAVEHVGKEIFNKAQTMDAGFVEAQKLGVFDCFIFHDVDLIPANMCNVYRCHTKGVRHLVLSKGLINPVKGYLVCIGGASAFTKDQFVHINGFTTAMFGWGGEDDDAYFRIKKENMQLFRYQHVVGNYYSLPHQKFGEDFPKVYRAEAVYSHWRYRRYDGLNSLTYTLVNVTRQATFTRIRIRIPGPTEKQHINQFLMEKREIFHKQLCRETNSTFCVKTVEVTDTTTEAVTPG